MIANFCNNYSTWKELKPSVREYFLDPESWSKKNFGEFWNIDWRLWNKCKNEFNQGSPGFRGSKKLIDLKPSKIEPIEHIYRTYCIMITVSKP